MRRTKAVLIFFVCGLASGLCFGTLLSTRSLMTFWFIKGDKFLIPTYRYYLGVGIFLVLGLAAAYTISRMAGLLRENSSSFRKIVSSVIVGSSPVILFITASTVEERTATIDVTDRGTILFPNIDPITLYFLGTLVLIVLISTACWILTSKLSYIGLLLNLSALPVAFCLLVIAAKVLVIPGEWSEVVTYTISFSLLGASCGFWITANRGAI